MFPYILSGIFFWKFIVIALEVLSNSEDIEKFFLLKKKQQAVVYLRES